MERTALKAVDADFTRTDRGHWSGAARERAIVPAGYTLAGYADNALVFVLSLAAKSRRSTQSTGDSSWPRRRLPFGPDTSAASQLHVFFAATADAPHPSQEGRWYGEKIKDSLHSHGGAL